MTWIIIAINSVNYICILSKRKFLTDSVIYILKKSGLIGGI